MDKISETKLIECILKYQTSLSIGQIPVLEKEMEEQPLSEKAQKVHDIIHENDFGCKKDSVLKLVSALIDENIDIPKKEKKKDGDLKLIIEPLSIVIALIDTIVTNDIEIKRNDILLKLMPVSEGCLDESIIDLFDKEDDNYWVYLNIRRGTFVYIDSLTKKEVRFASDEEIKKSISFLTPEERKLIFKPILLAYEAFGLLEKE